MHYDQLFNIPLSLSLQVEGDRRRLVRGSARKSQDKVEGVGLRLPLRRTLWRPEGLLQVLQVKPRSD